MFKTIKNYTQYIRSDPRIQKLNFDKDGRNHYVYRITNLTTSKYYYGSRVTKLDPSLDLGTKYFSSSSDKIFVLEQKSKPYNFKYKIIKIFDNSGDTIIYESFLHQKLSVSSNINFYNKSNQRPFGFSLTNNPIVIAAIYKTRTTADENGLTSYDKAGPIISLTLNQIQESGKTRAKEIGEKGSITRKLIQENGLSINQENIIKQKKTKNIIQSNGKTNAENGASKAAKTMKKLDENGLSIYNKTGINQRGKNHNLFKGYYVINGLQFETIKEAEKVFVLLSSGSISRYCKFNDMIISKSSYHTSKYLKTLGTKNEIIGQTFKSLGFDFIKI